MNTKNIKNDFITWLGVIFLIAALVITTMSIIKWDFDTSIVVFITATILFGLGLMLAPKDLYGVLKDKISK